VEVEKDMDRIEEAPSTPASSAGLQASGSDSIGSRVKQRKGGKS